MSEMNSTRQSHRRILFATAAVLAGFGAASAQAATPISGAGTTYNQSDVGVTVTPDFQGGTLLDNQNNVTDSNNYTVENFPTNTIDAFGNQTTFAGSLSGAGPMTITDSIGGGRVVISGASYAGATTIDPGATLALVGPGALSVSARLVDDGSFDISGVGPVGFAQPAIKSLAGGGAVLLGDKYLTITAAADTFSGDISGTGGLIFTGGIQTLSGVNAFTGGVTINAGAQLTLSDAGSMADSVVGVRSQGVLDVSATASGATILGLTGQGEVLLQSQTLTLSNANTVFSGVISGTGGLTIEGGVQGLNGASTNTGATTIDAGATLVLSGDAIADSIKVVDNGVLDVPYTLPGFARTRSLAGSGVITLEGTLFLTDAADTFSGSISGFRLTITGGTEILTGSNTLVGLTEIDPGATLQLGNGGAAPLVTSPILDDGALIFNYGADMLYAASLSGQGSVTVASTGHALVLTGDDQYYGGTIINAGAALYLGNGGTSGAIVGDVADNGALVFDRTDVVTFDGAISGNGSVAVPSGAVTLTAVNSYSGPTAIGYGGARDGD